MVIEERFVKRFELVKHNISAKLEFITENFLKNPTMNKTRLITMALVIIASQQHWFPVIKMRIQNLLHRNNKNKFVNKICMEN